MLVSTARHSTKALELNPSITRESTRSVFDNTFGEKWNYFRNQLFCGQFLLLATHL